ncbi:MAG: hypothetical protein AB7T63_17325, partial [Planctomycetota bacterium]
VLAFPLGQHDDIVDCLGYAVAAGRSAMAPRAVTAVRSYDPTEDPASPFAGPRPASPFARPERLFGQPGARRGRPVGSRRWP